MYLVVIQLIVMLSTVVGLEPDSILSLLVSQSKGTSSATLSESVHLRPSEKEPEQQRESRAIHAKQKPHFTTVPR